MVVYEIIEGTDLVHAYSDKGVKIHGGMPEADYNEAIDIEKRTYEETDIPVDTYDDDATDDDYLAALRKVGVDV